ncbi:MAG: DUF4395 domain-containing protein [Anaerolineales bacterium]
MSRTNSMVDHNALRANQAIIIALLLLAFVLDSTVLVAFIGLTMLLGTATGRPGFILAYRTLESLDLLQADPIPDHPEPHRFAQFVGSVFLLAATGFLLTSINPVGWALAWVVIALAALNLFVGFCVGCAMYYWLSRLGAPGFELEPPAGTQPGWRPEGGDA